MKKFILILSFLAAVACAPVPYYIGVEVHKDSNYQIDLEGRNVSVIAIAPYGDKDSALVSEVGMGIAEKIEQDRGLSSGTIPVYSVYSESVIVDEPGSLDLVAIQTSSDLLLVLDSLSIDEYIVAQGGQDNMVYRDGGFLHVTDVKLPAKALFTVYDSKILSVVKKTVLDDTLAWTLVSETQTPNVKAIAKANSTLKDVFKEIGSEFASNFSQQWEMEDRMVIAYDSYKWMNAYHYASAFKWQQAMDIWLELVKTYNPKQSACAAYNIAVACEMLERYDVALKWLDYAKEKYYFRENGELREVILREQGRK